MCVCVCVWNSIMSACHCPCCLFYVLCDFRLPYSGRWDMIGPSPAVSLSNSVIQPSSVSYLCLKLCVGVFTSAPLHLHNVKVSAYSPQLSLMWPLTVSVQEPTHPENMPGSPGRQCEAAAYTTCLLATSSPVIFRSWKRARQHIWRLSFIFT